jgi:endonuclease YncB( thermonuclease family)
VAHPAVVVLFGVMHKYVLLSLATFGFSWLAYHAVTYSHAIVHDDAPGISGTISGRGVAIDGDTIIVDGIHVRLKGVDSEEVDTPLGNKARDYLAGLVDGRVIQCTLTGEITWHRQVGYCHLAGASGTGEELGAKIISAGFALACPRYSTRYVPYETANGQLRAQYCLHH